jgi:hypothetical protein
MTDKEIRVASARRAASNVAEKLRTLADRIERIGSDFATTDLPAAVAADIVGDFTQGVGSIGAVLWQVVRNAEDLAQTLDEG